MVKKVTVEVGDGMRWLNQLEGKRNRVLLALVAAGFVAGLILMNMGKKALLENTGLLSEYTLILAVLSTTWLGLAATWTCAAWLGISFGMLVMASVLRYGLKGILLILVGVFPQILVYFPVALLLLQWSYEFCTAMYFPSRASRGAFGSGEPLEKNQMIRRKVVQFLFLLIVVIIGCILESYVNPKLVSNLLKIF